MASTTNTIDASAYRRPASLELTRHPDANALVAQDPAALVIGWVCDQQVRVQQAFHVPELLRERLGTLDPAELAAMPVERIVKAFTEKPPLHRYGRSMGTRVHECMKVVSERYGGDAERIWLDATDYEDLARRIGELPGFGPTKVPAFIAMLARRFGLAVTGFEDKLPPYGSLSEVTSYDELRDYQARKHVWKLEQKASATPTDMHD